MVKSKIFFLLILILIIVTFLGINYKNASNEKNSKNGQVLNSQTSRPTKKAPQVTVVVENLDTPWSVAFLPNEDILFTERNGALKLYENHIPGNTEATLIGKINGVLEISEGGLLGLALHPNYIKNTLIYVYYTYLANSNQTLNRVSQFNFDGVSLGNEKVIVDKIPGAPNHNGGRIKFGPDNFLYITTGDAQEPSLAQNKNSLAGKILRVTDQGQGAPGNPFADGKSGSPLVYSYGHRNPQGITWAGKDRIYELEHGQSSTDEFNYIDPGKNYGWPTIRGDQTAPGMESPFWQSGDETWAPGGAAYFDYPDYRGSIFFGGLRGQALYELEFIGDNRTLKTHFKNKFGRIRDVVLGPDNMLYITTSNNDGRGTPQAQDDKILKINPEKL